MDGVITKILEVKILEYLLGLLQVHRKSKTAEILWGTGFGVITSNLAFAIITLPLAFLVERFNPLGHGSLSPIERF